MSTVQANRFTDSSGGVLAPISSVMRNRIINGAMVIDQRNAGASVAVPNGTITYGADRFLTFEDTSASGCTIQQVTDAPTGFNNSLKFTVGTGGSATASQLAVLETRVEGYNFADLGFGTANAKTFTLSFLVKSSATGTYCVAFRNASDNRSYVATYTVSAANTWEQKTITVTGDTTGTWETTNGIGISVRFDMGSGSTYQTSTLNAWQAGLFFSNSSQVNIIGTNSASLQITGVQLEVGTQATSFEYRQYTTELQLCQRYFVKTNPDNALICGGSWGAMYDSTSTSLNGNLPVTMRVAPTFARGGTNNNFFMNGVTSTSAGTTQNFSATTTWYGLEVISMSTGAKGNPVAYNGQASLSAEL
jgi:hypothetical protein